MNAEFNKMRTELANSFASAGAALLDYMSIVDTPPAALAAIPETDPQQYVVAGTLAGIAQMLPKAAPLASHPQAEPVGEFAGYVDGIVPVVDWVKGSMPKVGDKLYLAAAMSREVEAVALLRDAIKKQLDPSWECNSDHPALHAALKATEHFAAAPMGREAQAEPRMFGKLDVMEAWACVRKNNHSISDAALDDMRDVLLSALAGAATVAQGEQADGWISVGERLPEPGMYLVNSTWGVRPAYKHEKQWAGGCFQEAISSTDEGDHGFEGFCAGPFKVTHWMPLPTAPNRAGDTGEQADGGAHA